MWVLVEKLKSVSTAYCVSNDVVKTAESCHESRRVLGEKSLVCSL